MAPDPINAWGIVELMGHRKTAGRITEEQRFGTNMCRVDVPQPDGTVRTEMYGGSAIYGVHLTDEATARKAAARFAPEPHFGWLLNQRALAAPGEDDEEIEVDEFDADTGGQHDDDPDDADEACVFCAEPLGDEPTTRVETGPDGEGETWHERCAKEHAQPVDGAVDSDQPRGDL